MTEKNNTQTLMADYNEVKCDYNNQEGFWTVDAWKTSDPEEEGKVVAVIEENTCNVYYINALARGSEKVQNAIRERINAIAAAKIVKALTD